MANSKSAASFDLLTLPRGVYLNECSYGKVHQMDEEISPVFNCREYIYTGTLHFGEIQFLGGEKLQDRYPSVADRDHGYTFEGIANDIFEVVDALNRYNDEEGRTFNYIKPGSRLIFKGVRNRVYEIHIRIYDNIYGVNNNRWVVIFAR